MKAMKREYLQPVATLVEISEEERLLDVSVEIGEEVISPENDFEQKSRIDMMWQFD